MEMLRRARSAGALKEAGLPALGRIIVRHPWLVIAGWLALVATLLLGVTPLAVVAQQKPPGLLPEGSSVLAAINSMQDAFHESGAGNGAIVVLTNENGLTKRDEQTYRVLVDTLRADTKSVTGLQDFFSTPELRSVMTSQDLKGWQLPVSLSGTMGEAGGQEAYRDFLGIVHEKTAGTTLKANVIGASATVDDLNNYGLRDAHVMEIATVVIVLTILIAVYRNVVAMVVPLLMIAVALGVSQGAVAGLGELGVIGLGPQTLVLMTAMMVGAGTDYAIFLFSRYHDCVRNGMSSDDSVIAALGSIGKVVAGSAGTVAITFMGLAFTKLGVFSTVGPALSVTVGVGFLASITLLPAIVVLVGRRGWIKPRKELTSRFWRRSGIRIVRRPIPHLAVSLVILIALACCGALVKYNYDDRKNLPADAVSNLGYDALAKHFPVSSTVPQFLFIQSSQDLRTPRALADMEEMARPNCPATQHPQRARNHPAHRRSARTGESHLPGRRSGKQARRCVQIDLSKRLEPEYVGRRTAPDGRHPGPAPQRCARLPHHHSSARAGPRRHATTGRWIQDTRPGRQNREPGREHAGPRTGDGRQHEPDHRHLLLGDSHGQCPQRQSDVQCRPVLRLIPL